MREYLIEIYCPPFPNEDNLYKVHLKKSFEKHGNDMFNATMISVWHVNANNVNDAVGTLLRHLTGDVTSPGMPGVWRVM